MISSAAFGLRDIRKRLKNTLSGRADRELAQELGLLRFRYSSEGLSSFTTLANIYLCPDPNTRFTKHLIAHPWRLTGPWQGIPAGREDLSIRALCDVPKPREDIYLPHAAIQLAAPGDTISPYVDLRVSYNSHSR